MKKNMYFNLDDQFINEHYKFDEGNAILLGVYRMIADKHEWENQKDRFMKMAICEASEIEHTADPNPDTIAKIYYAYDRNSDIPLKPMFTDGRKGLSFPVTYDDEDRTMIIEYNDEVDISIYLTEVNEERRDRDVAWDAMWQGIDQKYISETPKYIDVVRMWTEEYLGIKNSQAV